MEKKGELLNQLAIISDLLEKVNLETKSVTLVIETNEKDFNVAIENVEKKYGKKIEKVDDTFTITIGFVDIIFNKSNV
jgi:hypothetical protein